MRVIEFRELSALTAQAAERPRRRLNINLHEDASDSIQRMVIAFEPETYIRPHRHPAQFETFILLCGRIALLSFNDDGSVKQRVEMAEDKVRMVEIPAGTWHSLASQAPGTLVMEIKPGPYQPTSEVDFASWAPPEGHGDAGACREWMRLSVPEARF